MRNRLSMVIMLTLFIIMGVIAPANAQTLPLPAARQASKVFVSPSVLRAMQGNDGKGLTTGVRVIVSFETGRGRNGALSIEDVSTARASVLAALPAGSYQVVSTFNRIASVALEVNQTSLDALRAAPGVYAINLDQEIEAYMTEANALTGIASVHTLGYTGNGAVAAIIDTGVDSNAGVVHPALADDLVGQHCFRTENDCIGGPTSAEDEHGHGTHVAGMITGPQGVAPDAQFYALKVFTTGSTSDTNILNALDYVIALNTTTPGAVDLINMSLGGANFADQEECDANSVAYLNSFASLNSLGVSIFVATGNDAQITEVGSPGCVTGAIGVGSVGDATFNLTFSNCTDNGQADKVSCYSNGTPVQGEGELVDLMAPGCNIISLGLNEGTNASSCGTSMATPYAVGVAAVLIDYLNQHSMSMTPAQIEEHLEVTGIQVADYRMLITDPTFPRVSPPNAIGAFNVAVPTGFSLTSVTPSSISMAWTAAAGATSYYVYRSVDNGAPTQIATVTDPTVIYTDAAPACGLLTYYVRSFDGSLVSLPSNSDSGTARACPLAPTNLTLTPVDADTVDLAWTDNNLDETDNILQRRVDGGSYVDYQTLGAGTSLTYQDDALGCGFYDYRAVSVRNGDRSATSNVVHFTVCAPANDNFANPTAVTPGTAITYTETHPTYASEEELDPILSCKFGGADYAYQTVWYSITTTAATRVTVSTSLSTGAISDTTVGLYTYNGSTFSEVACGEDISGTNFRTTFSSNLDASTTYYVMVGEFERVAPGSAGNLATRFTWSAPVVIPVNDLYANATVITTNPFTGTVTSAQNATVSGTDPLHSCVAAVDGGPKVGTNTLWWKYTAPANGKFNADTLSSSGSMTDTILSVYSGSLGAFTLIGCNDDSTVNLRSQLTNLQLTAGTTYTIYVSRWGSTPTTTAGTIVLNTSFVADPGVTVSPTTVAVTEGGATDSYTVVLDTVPSADVTVTVTGDADCSVDLSSLTFTTANFSVAQTVTVTAVDDADIEGTHACTLTHSAAGGGYNAVSIASVTGTVTDNDSAPVASVTVSPTAVAITEGGATDSYTVVLDTVPSADVTVTVTGDANCSVDLPSLTFTTANFSVAQTVTVTAVDDADVEGTHACTITHSAAGGGYDAVSIASVSGTVTDNDSAVAGVELLTNGSFEVAGATAGKPAGWTVQAPTGDKRACPAAVANVHSGSCAFKFTGSSTDHSKLVQVVDLTGVTFTAGDTLTASAFFKGNNATAKVKIILFVTYTGNPTPVRTVATVLRNTSYTQHSTIAYTLTSGAVSQVKLMFNHMSHGGSLWIDDASLYQTFDGSPRGALLGLPTAPDGFRK